MSGDHMRTLASAELLPDSGLRLCWSDGIEADIAMPKRFKAVGQPVIGDWGHSLEWPDGTELGADSLWLDTLTAIGRGDARQFLEWRLRNGLSLTKAAEALGLARRTVAYYSNGDRPVPKAILLACKGWDASPELRKAA
ncbi:MAG: helix-turn-helix transcriptional regulator [Sphingopyxis sp.]|nr:helix-turn-helix transcriptional regulator [Sphingopyxis sp.]